MYGGVDSNGRFCRAGDSEKMTPTEHLSQMDQKLSRWEWLRDSQKRLLTDLVEEVGTLREEVALLEKADQVLLTVSSQSIGESTQKLDKLVTYGLRATFDDLNLRLQTVTDRSRGKTATKFEIHQDGQTYSLESSYGGGVLCIVGFLMRVMTIMAFGLRRVVLLDETFAHLSNQYHSNASKLVKRIVKDLGFHVIMVSHETAFAEHADQHYKIETGSKGVTFRKG